jgi:hypothetical protein
MHADQLLKACRALGLERPRRLLVRHAAKHSLHVISNARPAFWRSVAVTRPAVTIR